MEWLQVSIFFIGVFALFIWNRAEGRSDARKSEMENRELSTLEEKNRQK